jgi:hypothetical protein
MNKVLFNILSWTWGLPLTLIGGFVTVILMIFGYKPKRWGSCIFIEIGEGWGGIEMGAFFVCSKTAKIHTKIHELGHGCQNCIYGPLMIPLVTIPSAIRYWYRRFRVRLGFSNTDYDSIWFEKQATRLGALAYIKK